jgi:hypothetical protein
LIVKNMAANDSTYLALAVTGIIFLIIGYLKRKKIKRLATTGIRVEGVVFSIDREAGVNFGIGSQNSIGPSYYPVIRFVTADKEWVTQTYYVSTFPRYKEGDKVIVIYNPEKITEFIIDDISTKLVSYLFWLGILMIAAGVIVFVVTT